MERYYSTINQNYLFNNIDIEDLKHILGCLGADIKYYKSDEFLFFAGDRVNLIGIVVEGIVEIMKESLSGNRHIIALLDSSHMFAEGIVSTENKLSPVTARARANTKILWIPFDRIIRTCGAACNYHIKLIHNMITILGEKNIVLNKKIELLTLKGMREKLARYLLNESLERGERTFNILLNRIELSDYLNVSRTSMTRELTRMQEDGLIYYKGKKFKILNEEALVKCLE